MFCKFNYKIEKYRACGCEMIYPVVEAVGYNAPFSVRVIPISL